MIDRLSKMCRSIDGDKAESHYLRACLQIVKKSEVVSLVMLGWWARG